MPQERQPETGRPKLWRFRDINELIEKLNKISDQVETHQDGRHFYRDLLSPEVRRKVEERERKRRNPPL